MLIAEDSLLIAMDLENILTAFGCEVIGPVSTVGEAIDLIAVSSIDAAILDFLLADGSAEPLAEYLDDKGIPFAICTGTEEHKLSEYYPRTPILGKPYDSDDVRMLVNGLIACRLTGS
ncbi:response regulator [Hyphomicrobium sp. MC8b]|uniref:response regulator n=1 Tax=Hyphomicrobium sp. MC8b TaxID=300273 RepID=UPI00391C1FDD